MYDLISVIEWAQVTNYRRSEGGIVSMGASY